MTRAAAVTERPLPCRSCSQVSHPAATSMASSAVARRWRGRLLELALEHLGHLRPQHQVVQLEALGDPRRAGGQAVGDPAYRRDGLEHGRRGS